MVCDFGTCKDDYAAAASGVTAVAAVAPTDGDMTFWCYVLGAVIEKSLVYT